MKRISVIDSHTAGEPTRVVVSGGPDLGRGTVAEQLNTFREQHDHFRSAIVNEPRGSDVMVGALLVPPRDPSCVAGVIFFNNVGCLGMCGHGTIGLVATLAHMGRIAPGAHRVETPVGIVTATLHDDSSVSVQNVPSYRKAKAVKINVPGIGAVVGDVAWGGNWFYLVEDHGQELSLRHVEKLTEFTWRIRQAINAQGFAEVDHVELFGPPAQPGAHARNFVLCPGKAYDRSPCGTGTSAKIACLAADGKLREGQTWIQESIIGGLFRGTYTRRRRGNESLIQSKSKRKQRLVTSSPTSDDASLHDHIIPTITGAAFVNSEATLLLDERDPFCWGFSP